MSHRSSSGSGIEVEPSRSDALGTLVLWPSGFTEVDVSREVTDPWPVFVVVIGADSADDALLDLLDTARSPTDTITNSRCWWSVDDPDRAMLRLAVRVTEPAHVAMDIAVPAQCFLGLSDVLAAGATVGVTSRRHARRLTVRTDDRASLDEILLLGSRTSSELGELAEQLCGTRAR